MRSPIFIIVFINLLFFPVILKAQSIEFSGNRYPVMEIQTEKSTGIDLIYVLYDTKNVSMTYVSEDNNPVSWEIYSNLGGGYAQEISGIDKDGNSYTLNNIEGDRGYIIKDGDTSFIFWMVNYADYYFKAQGLYNSGEQDCMETSLIFEGFADAIDYYTINGRKETLSREIVLEYDNLNWSEENKSFISETERQILDYINERIIVIPPNYCNTIFTLKGDRFLNFWDLGVSIESDMIPAVAVRVMTFAEEVNSPESEEGSNIMNSQVDGLGGSAPCVIDFYAYVTDAVVHYEWQIADDEEFNFIVNRFYDQDLSYTFEEEGQKYVRFIGSNYDGTCEDTGDTYTISIGASELLIPNAFSPNDDGVNDIWKVSYRSLIDFKCWIFDRHGHQLFYFDDPNSGWDGKKNGKVVKSGVYYYVIQATGADGKNYKKSGDINILNYKKSSQEGATDY